MNPSVLPQMKSLVKVVEHIFDRDAALTPGYLMVDAIQKAYPDNRHWPHWVNFKHSYLRI